MAGAQGGRHENVSEEVFWESIERYQLELDDDSELRDSIKSVVKELEKAAKKVNFVILGIHAKPTVEHLKAVALKARGILEKEVRPLIATLAEKVPRGDYYKFHDHWRICFQRLSFVAVTVIHLESGQIAKFKDTASLIGVPSVEDRGDSAVFLDYEEYLYGLLEMAGEYARLTRNCVTFGDNIQQVYTIHKCVNQLNVGMQQITFKNDYLRKKYDGLKYHLKSVEEVIYDLTVRAPRKDDTTNVPTESESKSTDKPTPSE